MDEVIKLLPCPFCGCVPERLLQLDHTESDAFWHRGAGCILSDCGIHREKWKAWNTRALDRIKDQSHG